MFCKPPHPVYIVLFRGDDTDFVGNQEIVVKITTERNISGCKAYFKYMGNIQTFDEIPEDKELHLVFSREQTKEMPLGTWDAELYLIDENGKRMTVNNRIHMLVTNSVGEAYFPDDPQAVSVVISANKYIEDAEVSANGKTLTLTKKDGTEVSFSGGGGGTNDYNDLENKPSINGTTLTGNVNLATPEQLSLKADKANVYTKTEVDEKVDAVDNKADEAYSAAEQMVNAVNSLAGTLGTHIRDTNNPHKVTAEQVGAYTTGEVDGKLAAKADEFTPWMFAGETAGYDNLSVVIESVYEGAAFDYKLYSGDTFIAGFTDSSDSLTVAYFITIDATKRITATRKRILYTGGSVSIGESTGGGGTIEVTGSGASIKKNGKEVATEEQVAAKADKTALEDYVACNAQNTVGSSFSVQYHATTGEGDDFSFGIGSGPGGKTFLVDKLYCSGKNRFFADGIMIINGTSATGTSILDKITEYGGDFKSALDEVKGLIKADAATMESLAPEYSPSSAYSVVAFVYHDGNIYQCTTAIADGGEAWNAAHWELRKLDDFFTESNSLLTGTIESKVNSMFANGDTTSYPRPTEG